MSSFTLNPKHTEHLKLRRTNKTGIVYDSKTGSHCLWIGWIGREKTKTKAYEGSEGHKLSRYRYSLQPQTIISL